MRERYNDDSIFTVKSQKGYLAKKALLDAGIDLIADYGIYGFSISDLCKKAGRKRTVFYTYFDTLEHFFDELSMRENRVFEDDFEKLNGQSYAEMTPGLKRMVLTLKQFFAIAQSKEVWNRFVVKLFSQHAPTATVMFKDIHADVIHAINSGDFQLQEEDAVAYAQLVLASLSINTQGEGFEQVSDPEGLRIINFLLDAGKATRKDMIEHLQEIG